MALKARLKIGDAVWVSKAHNLGVIMKIEAAGKKLRYLVEWDSVLSKDEKPHRYSEREITLVLR